jgi:nicotinamide-nucleotide amidase
LIPGKADAEIVAAGSEMLTPQRVDTNSLWLTDRLNALGVEVVAKTVVGDDRARLAEAVAGATKRSPIVIVTGGLGPTEDDVTRDAVAEALGRQLEFRQELCDGIAERFRRMNRPMAEINKRQAWAIEGSEALENPNGTAPGLWIRMSDGRVAMLLPGPPSELKPMFTNHCEPRLRASLPELHIATLELRVAGIGESDLDALISPVYTQYMNPVTTVLASPGDVQVHLRARCTNREEALALVSDVGGKIDELLGKRVYSRNGDSLEAALGRLLRGRGETLAVAESCTGGLLGERITAIAGSSDYFLGGFLTYTNEMKTAMLGVEAAILATHTAVSEPVAKAMAAGSRERTGATYALSVTGYAGPDAGTEENPAGTVIIGLATPRDTQARRFRFLGDRSRVRTLAAITALDWLRRSLLESSSASNEGSSARAANLPGITKP